MKITDLSILFKWENLKSAVYQILICPTVSLRKVGEPKYNNFHIKDITCASEQAN